MKRKYKEGRYRNFFNNINNKELLNYCFSNYGRNIGRSELAKKDSGLHKVLGKRGLLEKLKLKIRANRNFNDMSNKELLDYCFSNYGKNVSRSEISKKDTSLYSKLTERELIKNIKPLRKIFLSDLNNSEILDYCFSKYGKNITRGELTKKDPGLYGALRKRELIKNIKISNRQKPRYFYSNMTNEQILDYFFSKFGKNITRGKLMRKSPGLYYQLKGRGLLYEIKTLKKEKGYWPKLENLKTELKEAIILNKGIFPSQEDLIKMNRSGLLNSIKYHGGMNAVREIMGYKPRIKQDWKNWDNVKTKLEEIIKENNGVLPSENVLCDRGYSGLIEAIREHHHYGMNQLRKKMNCEIKRNPNGYLRIWDNYKKEMKKAIKENNGIFPSQIDLKKMGHSTLAHHSKYHGGFNNVKTKLGYKIEIKPSKYWKKFENMKREMEETIRENNGEYPTQRDLTKMGKYDLLNGLHYYGGLYAVREKIGYNEQMRTKLAKDLEEIAERLVG